MSAASDLLLNRIISSNSEGFRADVYDDATGKPIECQGEPTVGYGCRVRGWSKALSRGVLGLQLTLFEMPLLMQTWYLSCNDARRSALLEIQYNQFGESPNGLKSGYPHLVAAVAAEDWATAADECTVEQENLKPRYESIARILSTGVAV